MLFACQFGNYSYHNGNNEVSFALKCIMFDADFFQVRKQQEKTKLVLL